MQIVEPVQSKSTTVPEIVFFPAPRRYSREKLRRLLVIERQLFLA